MKRYRQTFEEIEASLSRIDSSWMDSHAHEVIAMLERIPKKKGYGEEDIMGLLDTDHKNGSTVIRLLLDQSKDEFVPNLTAALSEKGARHGSGVKCYRAFRSEYVAALIEMGLVEKMTEAVNRPLNWFDSIIERLKGVEVVLLKDRHGDERWKTSLKVLCAPCSANRGLPFVAGSQERQG